MMEGSNAKRGQRSRRRRGGRPTKAEAALVEDRLLAIAAELFARDGYAATSVERVASMCGAGKDTIYRRYASKRALFNAVLERSRKRIMARLDDLGAGSAEQDSLAQLRELTSCLLDINLDPELIAFKRIALSEMLIADSDRVGPEADAISDLLRAGRRAGTEGPASGCRRCHLPDKSPHQQHHRRPHDAGHVRLQAAAAGGSKGLFQEGMETVSRRCCCHRQLRLNAASESAGAAPLSAQRASGG
jgi:AcrR family transcriptional regulator